MISLENGGSDSAILRMKRSYEDGKPVMKMESDGVRMTFRFAEQETETDVKENIVNILTSQFIRRTVSAP